jgi:hypothetical protein
MILICNYIRFLFVCQVTPGIFPNDAHHPVIASELNPSKCVSRVRPSMSAIVDHQLAVDDDVGNAYQVLVRRFVGCLSSSPISL